ncbi:MAG: MarR family winged helix-turn-helix transcriptional regulator [Phycisphaerales bacterium]
MSTRARPARSTDVPAAVREIAGACLAVRARMVARALSAVYDRAMGELGLTISQVNIMVSVGMMGPCSPGRVGRSLHMERSTMSRNLRRLLEQRLIAGEPAGSERLRSITITPAGVRAIEKALPLWRRAQDDARALLGQPGTGAILSLGDRLFAGAA